MKRLSMGNCRAKGFRFTVRVAALCCAVLAVLVLLAPYTAQAAQKLRIGCLGAGTSRDMIELIQKGVANKGYEIEIVSFNENQLPATALAEGELDGFINNQIVWLQAFNQRKGTNLQMLKPYIYYPGYAAYSAKHKTIDAIPEGAKITVPGDPSNLERCLLIMQAMGLITLDQKSGDFYSLLDVKDNPKNVKVLETEITATVRHIQDVDVVICTANIMREAGLNPRAYLFEDPSARNFPVSLVVHPKDADSDWAKAIMDFTQTDTFRNGFDELFQGSRVLYPKVGK